MTHRIDPKLTEADVERSRATLAATLDALQGRLQPGALTQDALRLATSTAMSQVSALGGLAKRNPLGVALTGLGLAWLAFGGRKAAPAAPVVSEKLEAYTRWEDEGGNPAPLPEVDEDWSRELDGLRARATEALRKIEADARAYKNDLRDGLADRYAHGRDFAAERVGVMAKLGDDLKTVLHNGLDHLSDSARAQAVAAREKAYEVRLDVERRARDGAREAARLVDENPLTASLAAFAFGIVAAALLPAPRAKEPESSVDDGDRLLREASQLLRDRADEADAAARIAREASDQTDAAIKSTSERAA